MKNINNYEHILSLPGFSENMMKNHLTLYEGYVKNVNLIDEKLKELSLGGKINTPEYNELKRRYAWEYNGVILHQLYFENMTGNANELSETSELYKEIIKSFESLDAWKNDFIATGAMRGIGWTILVREYDGALRNIWIDEHSLGFLAGSKPLLVMDVFEHSFMIDYGLKRADYINAFFNVIDYKVVEERMNNKE